MDIFAGAGAECLVHLGTIACIDEWIPTVVEHIAEMHSIATPEYRCGITGGVRSPEVHQIQSLAVHVELHRIIVSEHRQRILRVGFLGVGDVH